MESSSCMLGHIVGIIRRYADVFPFEYLSDLCFEEDVERKLTQFLEYSQIVIQTYNYGDIVKADLSSVNRVTGFCQEVLGFIVQKEDGEFFVYSIASLVPEALACIDAMVSDKVVGGYSMLGVNLNEILKFAKER